jgi:hypothetical protein
MPPHAANGGGPEGDWLRSGIRASCDQLVHSKSSGRAASGRGTHALGEHPQRSWRRNDGSSLAIGPALASPVQEEAYVERQASTYPSPRCGLCPSGFTEGTIHLWVCRNRLCTRPRSPSTGRLIVRAISSHGAAWRRSRFDAHTRGTRDVMVVTAGGELDALTAPRLQEAPPGRPECDLPRAHRRSLRTAVPVPGATGRTTGRKSICRQGNAVRRRGRRTGHPSAHGDDRTRPQNRASIQPWTTHSRHPPMNRPSLPRHLEEPTWTPASLV